MPLSESAMLVGTFRPADVLVEDTGGGAHDFWPPSRKRKRPPGRGLDEVEDCIGPGTDDEAEALAIEDGDDAGDLDGADDASGTSDIDEVPCGRHV